MWCVVLGTRYYYIVCVLRLGGRFAFDNIPLSWYNLGAVAKEPQECVNDGSIRAVRRKGDTLGIPSGPFLVDGFSFIGR